MYIYIHTYIYIYIYIIYKPMELRIVKRDNVLLRIIINQSIESQYQHRVFL